MSVGVYQLPVSGFLIRRFRRAYNGNFIMAILLWIVGKDISERDAEVMLARILEDALFSVYFNLSGGEMGIPVGIAPHDMYMLHNSIAQRIPRVKQSERHEYANALIDTLMDTLGTDNLRMEGAIIKKCGDGILIHLHPSLY